MQSSLLILAIAMTSSAQTTETKPQKLSADFKPLEVFVGEWEVTAEWTNGTKLWAKNDYRIGLGGNFLEATTFAKDDEGEVYERYRTVFLWDKTRETFVSHGFSHDGTVSVTDQKTRKTEDGRTIVESQWTPAGSPMTIKQKLEVIDHDSYSWKVWGRQGADGEWNSMMVGTWKRVK